MTQVNFNQSNNGKKNTIQWILGISLIIFGLYSIFKSSVFGGFLLFIVGIAILPPISAQNKIKYPFWNNNLLRRSVLGILAFMGLMISNIDDSKNKEDNNSNEVESKEAKTNKVELFNLGKVRFDENGKKVQPDSNDVTYRVIEVLDHSKNEAQKEEDNFENLHILIETSNKERETLKQILEEIRLEYATFAPENCNIDLWDDKKAYQAYLEQQNYYTSSFEKLMEEFQKTRVPIGEKHKLLKENYDRKHYPFIADHQIASISLGNNFEYYTLQDDYYTQVGGKNMKK